VPIIQSSYKFTTQKSLASLLKLYTDYLIKSKWTISSIDTSSGGKITAKKDGSDVRITITEEVNKAWASVNISIIKIEAPVTPN